MCAPKPFAIFLTGPRTSVSTRDMVRELQAFEVLFTISEPFDKLALPDLGVATEF